MLSQAAYDATAGGDRLVAEAERQLAQLQLSVGKNPGAKKPLTEAVPEKGPVAEEPKFTRSRAGRAAKENRRSSASASAAAAHSGGSAQKGAAGVSAMRAFWEKAGQPAEKPRAGTWAPSRLPLFSAKYCDAPVGTPMAPVQLCIKIAAQYTTQRPTPYQHCGKRKGVLG